MVVYGVIGYLDVHGLAFVDGIVEVPEPGTVAILALSWFGFAAARHLRR